MPIGWIAAARRKAVPILVSLSFAASVVVAGGWSTPAQAARAPLPASSRYMKTTKPGVLARLGCLLGRNVRRGGAPTDALVILAFGRPMYDGKDHGASVFSRWFHPTWDIREAAQAYARGYVRCVKPTTESYLRLGIGTSNYGRRVSFAHGRAWADMVNQANEWLEERGLSHQVDIVGANDIEVYWAGPDHTRAWVRGYDSVNRWPYYNFGNAAHCPPCYGRWAMEDVWYVSWGADPAIPLPEIYRANGESAREWYRVSLYSRKAHGERMHIAGVMSQRGACRHAGRSECRGVDNTPQKAWHQLWRTLNADPRTAQRLRWSTDITWRNRP